MVLRMVRRSLRRFKEQEMTDAAAALTYYALMGLLPLFVAATSLLSLVGDAGMVADFVDYILDHGADPQTARTVSDLMSNIVQTSSGAAGLTLVVSLAIALNGASGAFGAAGRALNRIEGITEDRGFVRRKLNDIAMALVIALLLVFVIAAVLLGGGLAEDLFDRVGLGAEAFSIWRIARWPVALFGAMLAYALIYTFAPDRDPLRLRLFTPGTVAGVAVWIAASIGFGIYIQNFSSYGAAYGAFAGVVVLLLWLWLSSCAFLLGAQLDHAIERDNLPAGVEPGDPLRRQRDPSRN